MKTIFKKLPFELGLSLRRTTGGPPILENRTNFISFLTQPRGKLSEDAFLDIITTPDVTESMQDDKNILGFFRSIADDIVTTIPTMRDGLFDSNSQFYTSDEFANFRRELKRNQKARIWILSRSHGLDQVPQKPLMNSDDFEFNFATNFSNPNVSEANFSKTNLNLKKFDSIDLDAFVSQNLKQFVYFEFGTRIFKDLMTDNKSFADTLCLTIREKRIPSHDNGESIGKLSDLRKKWEEVYRWVSPETSSGRYLFYTFHRKK